MFGFDGAIVTAVRPHGFDGSPLFEEISCHVAPPSVVLNRPLALGAAGPSPPERKVHPLRRKSHRPAKSTFGFDGSMVMIEQPVEALGFFSTFVHVLPPSLVLYTPRSSLSLHSLPGTQA